MIAKKGTNVKIRIKPDPLLPQYTNLDEYYKTFAYNLGHQMDAYDCGCDSIDMAVSRCYY